MNFAGQLQLVSSFIHGSSRPTLALHPIQHRLHRNVYCNTLFVVQVSMCNYICACLSNGSSSGGGRL